MQDALLDAGLRNLVVQAGAGTGKTHALLTIVLHLLGGGGGRAIAPSRLVLLTFTDKAALQLRDRLEQRVAALTSEPPDACEPELVTAFAQAGRECPPPATWREIQHALHDATIATFHAFCAAQLRRFASEAGLDPTFEMLDDPDARALFDEAARSEVLAALGEDDVGVRSLIEQLGLGGALASGLVDLLRSVSARMLEEGRSAAELDDGRWDDRHWRAMLDDARERLLASAKALRQRPPRALLPHLDELDTLLAEGPARTASDLQRAVDHLRGTISGGRGEPLLAEFDEARIAHQRALAARESAPLGRAFVSLLARADERYGELKAARNVLDFGDLQRRYRQLLQADADVRRLATDAFDAILVDELQDTNRVQQEIVALLGGTGGISQPHWTPGRTTVVGDRKQAIYAFRGAELGGVQRLEESLLRAEPEGARLVHLRRSFRSRPALVAITNALAARLFPTEEQPVLEPVRPEAPQAWPAEVLEAKGASAEAQRADEAARIAARIARMLRDESDPVRVQSAGEWRRAEPRDVVLLFRRLTTVDVYRQALAAQGIPHAVVGGGSFFERLEIIDTWALLAAIADPTDAYVSAALLRSPWCALSDATLTTLSLGGVGGRARPRGLALSRLESERPRLTDPLESQRFDALLAFVARMRGALDHLGTTGVLALALEELDYLAVASAQADAETVAANLGKLETLLRKWERDRSPREVIRHLGDRVRRAPREPEAMPFDESAPTGVRLMTVHQAKGLEFPVVFVADCGASEPREADRVLYDSDLGLGLSVRLDDDELVPDPHLEGIRQRQRERARAESARLLYVAATRARDHLVFSGSARNGSWTEVVAELPPSLLHRVKEP